MPELIIGEATGADAAAIANLLRTAFEEYRDVLNPPSGAHNETADRVLEKMKIARAALARWDGVALGCVFYEQEDDVIYLSRLAVLPEYRQRGIGRALVRYVEDRARTVGLRRVQLAVRLSLPKLRASYHRMGYQFVRLGSHEGSTRPTYALLEKQL